jgi:glycosyltransferase involved in cell wall biosynthesis
MNVALVHDWLNQRGGAEDVLETLVSQFPESPVYTSLYEPKVMPESWQEWDIRTSFINRLPMAKRRQQLYLPFYPMAFEQFDFKQFDLVISNKSGFCHGIVTEPSTMHICYCLTPTRYVWRYQQYAERERISPLARMILPPILVYLRAWDRAAAERVDHFIAISDAVRRRIAKVYRRESTIIYPPVDTSRFEPSATVDDYYLIVGRLVPYRRVDVLIEAFNQMGKPLLIAGSGRDRQRLEELAGPTITFLGYVPDGDLPDLFARCQAFLFPGEEDFGIAPIQAMAAGRPVIAYAAGGAVETVIPGCGVLFAEQSVAAIIEAVENFDTSNVDSAAIRSHSMKFDTTTFNEQLSNFVEQKFVQAKKK